MYRAQGSRESGAHDQGKATKGWDQMGLIRLRINKIWDLLALWGCSTKQMDLISHQEEMITIIIIWLENCSIPRLKLYLNPIDGVLLGVQA